MTRRGQHLDAGRQLGGIRHEMGDRPRAELRELVEFLVERGHERLVRGHRHLAVEELARLGRAHHRCHWEGAGAADVIDVRVRQHQASDRTPEPADRGCERLPLRANHERVDHRQAVVVGDHARVADARFATRLQPDPDALGQLVQGAGWERRHGG